MTYLSPIFFRSPLLINPGGCGLRAAVRVRSGEEPRIPSRLVV